MYEKKQFRPPKLQSFLRMASQIAKACTLVSQITKTFENDQFWRNISIIPLSRVIFQLKKATKLKKIPKKLKKIKNYIYIFIYLLLFFFLKKKLRSIRGHTTSFKHRRWARCMPATRQTSLRFSERGHG